MAWFSNAAGQRRAKAREQKRLEEAKQRERKRRAQELNKEADYFGERIVKVAANRGFMQVLRGILEPNILEIILQGKSLIRTLKFTHVLLEESRLWFRIDAGDLPRPITLNDLKEDHFLHTLSIALMRPVKYLDSPKAGAFFVVERDGHTSGIPKYVPIKRVEEWITATAPPLAIAIGQSDSQEPLLADLAMLPHLMVAGTTFSGKSVWLNQMVCTLIARNSPQRLQMVLIDLKNGLELGIYQQLPHLYRSDKIDGFAATPKQAEAALNAVIDEMNRRGKMFTDAGVRDIGEFNDRRETPLPYLVVIIDELSRLLLNMDKEIVRLAKILLNDVLSVGRAYGIHVILCTQSPDKRIVPQYLKNNCSARICFNVPGIQGSIAVLENKRAHRLSPQGRGIFQNGIIEREFQGPMITTKQTKRHIRRIIETQGKSEIDTSKIGLMDLVDYALLHRDGSLAWEHLAEEFAPKGCSAKRIKQLIASVHNKEVERNGYRYLVQPAKGRYGTRLVFLGPIIEETPVEDTNLMAAD